MLLFDLSGIVVHTCINLHHESREEVTVNSVRHVAFSSLLYYKKRFSKTHGLPIVCADRKPYWRDAVHKYYKKNRDKARKDSKIDWKAFSEHFKQVQEDINEFSPYPFIAPARTEADDSISVLTQYASARKQPVMIVSSDKDMIQLQQRFPDVKQYSPSRKKLLTLKDADYDLLTHIIKGDTSDGIPNIFSPSDILMTTGGPKQKSVTKKMLEEVHALDDPLEWSMLDDDSKAKFKRNRLLIDTSRIPGRIKDAIIEQYEQETATKKPNRMMACVKKYRLRQLFESVREF